MKISKRLFIVGMAQLAFAGFMKPARALPLRVDGTASPLLDPLPPSAGQLSTPHASPGAQVVYRYIVGLGGRKTLTGQMESIWDGGPRSELDYILTCSGKLPAILGLDFLNPLDNSHVVERAAHWYLEEGGIPTMCWHWGAPDIGTGYENAKKAFDLPAALTDGTPQNKAMMRDLDAIGAYLKELQKRGVPVLWRPLHEFTGTWFWWGQHGPETFKRLWIKMHDYFTRDLGLDNLIWVLGYADRPEIAYYPGRQYVDIAGADTYVNDHGPLKEKYDLVKDIVGDGVPIALHENGPIPDPDLVEKAGANWCYFMTWHTKYIKDPTINAPEFIKTAYNSERYVTKDELPAFK